MENLIKSKDLMFFRMGNFLPYLNLHAKKVVATIIVATTLMTGSNVSHAEPITSKIGSYMQNLLKPVSDAPSDGCIEKAKGIAVHFQNAANTLAGVSVSINIIPAKVLDNTTIAEVNSNNEVEIQGYFCKLPLEHQKMIIAHELGHVIDFQVNDDKVSEWEASPLAYSKNWHIRPQEISANLNARALYIINGENPNFINAYQPK